MIKLNIGCAARPLGGYINIDMDSKEDIIKRYPSIVIPDNIDIFQYDIFNLPFEDCSVNEVRCDCVMEHLSFKEEKIFWQEVKRVLKKSGAFNFCVPDFEFTVKAWLLAEDNWLEFYRDDDWAIKNEHWFGHYKYSYDSRWGYLIASIFGSQNGDGQFHKNAYTEEKIKAIAKYLSFKVEEITQINWKKDRPDKILKVKLINE